MHHAARVTRSACRPDRPAAGPGAHGAPRAGSQPEVRAIRGRPASARSGLGSLATGAVTAVALAVQAGLAAVVGVIIAREFGRSAETDGFFAAYGVFIVLALAANAIRLVVLPPLARAREERRLGQEAAGWAIALGVLSLPFVLSATVLAGPLADLLTGDGPAVARETAVETLPLVVTAGLGQVFAGLAASALAALDDYLTAAVGYIAASVAGLAAILLRLDDDGVLAVGIGMAVNGVLAVAIPSVVLAFRAHRASMPATGMRPHGASLGNRVLRAGQGCALPLVLQAAYLVCLPLAAREGVGAVTSFGYAYLAASAVVAATAASFGLVTSVPLTRLGLDGHRVAHHVVATSWLALLAIGAVAGVFAVAGEPVLSAVLGDGYVDAVGRELGRLVALLAPWMVVATGFSVAFPLVFVARRERPLALLSLGVLSLHVVLAVAGQALAGLTGLALALAATTAVALAGVLHALGAARETFAGLLRAAALVALVAGPAFLAADIVLPAAGAAAVGLVAYAAAVAILRPPGLVDSLHYLRGLA